MANSKEHPERIFAAESTANVSQDGYVILREHYMGKYDNESWRGKYDVYTSHPLILTPDEIIRMGETLINFGKNIKVLQTK